MKVITEERLQQLRMLTDDAYKACLLAELEIDECKELNPWLPVDKNTPKDRPVLLRSGATAIEGSWSQIYGDHWTQHWTQHWTGEATIPTHWCELPEDPK